MVVPLATSARALKRAHRDRFEARSPPQRGGDFPPERRESPTRVRFSTFRLELIAAKYDGSQRRGPGRPRVMETIRELVLTMAEENSSWGYTRIRGALANMGHEVGRATVKRILAEHGIEPAPARDKRTPWSTFLKAHWGAIAATDFFTVEVLTARGLIRYFVLFVIDLETRRVEIAGIVHQPYEDWMNQIVRSLRHAERVG